MNNKITILYVDDESLNLMLFEVNFKRHFNIVTASSGYEGLKVLKSNPGILVVISDMKMPGMNGLEFIASAKKKFPKIIYFILTGFDINEDIADALNQNIIQDYFQKPFKINEITNSIKEKFQ